MRRAGYPRGVSKGDSVIYGRHTGINVRDLGEALRFYVEVCGMRAVDARIEVGDYIDNLTSVKDTLQIWAKVETTDGYQLELVQWIRPLHLATWPKKEKYNRPGINHLCFRVSDAALMYGKLQDAGCRRGVIQTDPPGKVKNFHAYDPDGNIVEFVEVLDG